MAVTKLTPILIVPSIEESLPLWTEVMGFELAAEVKHGDQLGFVILQRGRRELMMQSESSLGGDLAALRAGDTVSPSGGVLFYADVDSLDEAVKAVDGATILVPRRKTYYGADEIWIRTRSGHVIGFAEHCDAEPPSTP